MHKPYHKQSPEDQARNDESVARAKERRLNAFVEDENERRRIARQERALFDGRRIPKHLTIPVTREEAADMTDAHLQGLHDELPREGCPECRMKGDR